MRNRMPPATFVRPTRDSIGTFGEHRNKYASDLFSKFRAQGSDVLCCSVCSGRWWPE